MYNSVGTFGSPSTILAMRDFSQQPSMFILQRIKNHYEPKCWGVQYRRPNMFSGHNAKMQETNQVITVLAKSEPS